mgnify:FL=1
MRPNHPRDDDSDPTVSHELNFTQNTKCLGALYKFMSMAMNLSYTSVDEYINDQKPEVQERLLWIKSLLEKNYPNATAHILYGMPAYKLNKKPLVYFAVYEKHLGFYATPGTHEAFKSNLVGYKTGKGSVQFPLKQNLPEELIQDMIAHRAQCILQNK